MGLKQIGTINLWINISKLQKYISKVNKCPIKKNFNSVI